MTRSIGKVNRSFKYSREVPMCLRRKSMIKSSDQKLPRQVAEAQSSATPKKAKRSKPVAFSVGDSALNALLNLPTDPPPITSAQAEESTARKVEQAKGQLGSLESEIISALFPAAGSPETFEALATRLGMSVKEVREVADSALRDLRGTRGRPPRPSSVWN
jgi:DNA-directed RNA polymerase sigma subunit (sigma70/sigma32)